MSYRIEPIVMEEGNEVDYQSLLKPRCADLGLTHPIRMSIVGASGSGKSVLISNLLCRPEYYYGFFSRLIVISPNYLTDKAYGIVEKACEKLERDYKFELIGMTSFDPDVMNALLDEIKDEMASAKAKYKNSKNKQKDFFIPRTCIVLDDCIDDEVLLRSRFLKVLATRGRHMGITTIIGSQSFKLIPRTYRINASITIMYAPRNVVEGLMFFEECFKYYTKKEFEALMNTIFTKPFQFLLINPSENRDKFLLLNNSQYVVKD